MHPFIIAGLGNPGNQYEKTRHNIGFQSIDFIASFLSVEFSNSKFKSNYAKAQIEGEKVILVKPMSYMNNSGEPIQKFINFFSVNIENLIIIHDDLDLPFGTIKIKKGGGSAGHNGIKSIINHLNNNNFIRVRFGIGKPDNINFETSNYVLSKFSNEENKSLENEIDKIRRIVFTIIDKGADFAMNEFN